MNNKKKIMLAGAVFGIALSIVLLMRSSEEEPVDQSVQAVKETFTCNKCGAQMELTIAQQAEMLSAKGGKIICKACGKEGPQKPVEIRVSGGGESPPVSAAAGPSGPTLQKEPPKTAGSRQKQQR